VEDLLQKERDTKNEAIVLLEQSRSGIAGDAEVAQSLEDEKRRTEALHASLRNDFKELVLKKYKC